MIFFGMAFLYKVFESTTMAMLASVVSAFMVVTMFILWFIWAAREVHVFTKLAKDVPVKDVIVEYSHLLFAKLSNSMRGGLRFSTQE
jgi:hypothetical protein